MVSLTPEEIKWLEKNFPNLSYNPDKGILSGVVDFDLQYNECKPIRDSYAISVDFSEINSRKTLPKVYNTDHRIQNAAKRKHKPMQDFHINSDSSLCLIFPPKFNKYFLDGFDIQSLMSCICNYLYWVSYYDLYDVEPWKGESHGLEEAFSDFVIDDSNLDYVISDKESFNLLRTLYKAKYGYGISVAKLKSKLQCKPFRIDLINLFKKVYGGNVK